MEGSWAGQSAPRPTMADVGRLAGVSRATVSFVVNDAPGQSIGAETRRRVLEAVDQLAYRPNRAAQGLRTRRTATIGFITHETPERSFADSAITGAHDIAGHHGSRLLLVTTGRSQEVLREALDDLIDRQVDAVIVAASGTRPITLPESIRSVPAALLNCFEVTTTLPTVLPDEEGGGYTAARLAIDAGHRDFAFLAGTADSWATLERVAGHRRALLEAGIDPRRQILAHGRYDVDAGHDLASDLIDAGRLPTVILCGNDRMAVGVLLALAQAGVRVPEDVSVVGYDDQVALASGVRPALTTVRLPYLEMGQWAVGRLLGRGSRAGEPLLHLVSCPPVVRQSLGAPRTPA